MGGVGILVGVYRIQYSGGGVGILMGVYRIQSSGWSRDSSGRIQDSV